MEVIDDYCSFHVEFSLKGSESSSVASTVLFLMAGVFNISECMSCGWYVIFLACRILFGQKRLGLQG